MLKRFTVQDYKEAFSEGFLFEETPLKDGDKRILGVSEMVRLELIETKEGELKSAALMFPLFLSDQERNRRIGASVLRFLELCLPFQVVPLNWFIEAKKSIKADEEQPKYESVYEGFAVMLAFLKDRSIYCLVAERR